MDEYLFFLNYWGKCKLGVYIQAPPPVEKGVNVFGL